MTNFEKITESPEALAEFIIKDAYPCTYCCLSADNCAPCENDGDDDLCKSKMKEWLNKPESEREQ